VPAENAFQLASAYAVHLEIANTPLVAVEYFQGGQVPGRHGEADVVLTSACWGACHYQIACVHLRHHPLSPWLLSHSLL
jgi:hypothetical protein